MQQYLQIVLTILGAGLMAYVAVRVALAQIFTRLDGVDEEQKKQDSRLDRLEGPYFSNKRR